MQSTMLRKCRKFTRAANPRGVRCWGFNLACFTVVLSGNSNHQTVKTNWHQRYLDGVLPKYSIRSTLELYYLLARKKWTPATLYRSSISCRNRFCILRKRTGLITGVNHTNNNRLSCHAWLILSLSSLL